MAPPAADCGTRPSVARAQEASCAVAAAAAEAEAEAEACQQHEVCQHCR